MAKKPLPVEEYDAALIARAAYFTVFQFRGRGDRHKVDRLANVDIAQHEAERLVGEYPDRPASIYAVDHRGMQAHVRNVGP